MNESTRGQCFQRCGPNSLRHGYHKVGITMKGDLKRILNHKDPNTITTGVNKEKIIQNISQNNNSRVLGGCGLGAVLKAACFTLAAQRKPLDCRQHHLKHKIKAVEKGKSTMDVHRNATFKRHQPRL
jgi:hypothetical protein